ncbi:SAM-dependent methyltransferase [Pseudonocardia sp. CA-107938]|uniref:SAM-dependent methyltransferase n=1 Tax=Pseudonocardia sp. CA-107938 TaxID=3240021 RepID=UPI003D920CE1
MSASAPGSVLYSASEENLDTAGHELRSVFGRAIRLERIGPDLGAVEGPSIAEVAEAASTGRMAFVQHLAVERARLAPGAGLADVVAAAVELAPPGADLAVQAWASGSPKAGYGSGEVFAGVRDALAERGTTVGRSGRELVLSVCTTERGVVLGLNRTADALCDWPGGRVRLAKGPGHVSRAEFKLEELFGLVPLDLPKGGNAVDLGAAPGGWTRIVRLRGPQVWAVDPGDMDPRVLGDPGVHHVRTTAGEFFRATDLEFDLVVNDMRMDPLLSCDVMLEAAQRLRPGALAVMTLKTGTHRPLETLQRCRQRLGARYDVVFARQLHHNRHELTVVLRRLRGRRDNVAS